MCAKGLAPWAHVWLKKLNEIVMAEIDGEVQRASTCVDEEAREE